MESRGQNRVTRPFNIDNRKNNKTTGAIFVCWLWDDGWGGRNFSV